MKHLILLVLLSSLAYGEVRETNLGVVGEINAEAGKAYRLVVDEVEGPVVTGIGEITISSFKLGTDIHWILTDGKVVKELGKSEIRTIVPKADLVESNGEFYCLLWYNETGENLAAPILLDWINGEIILPKTEPQKYNWKLQVADIDSVYQASLDPYDLNWNTISVSNLGVSNVGKEIRLESIQNAIRSKKYKPQEGESPMRGGSKGMVGLLTPREEQ